MGRKVMIELPSGLESRLVAYARRHGYASMGQAIRAACDAELKNSEGSARAVCFAPRLGRIEFSPNTRED